MIPDVLFAASIVVDDVATGVETLGAALGIPRPLPRWYNRNEHLEAVFCRVHPEYAVAPTRLEFVSSSPVKDDDDNTVVDSSFPVAHVVARQGQRAIKIHSTPIGMPQELVRELGEHLWDLSVAHDYLGALRSRVVIGPVGAFADARAGDDDGLFIEAIPSSSVGLPQGVLDAPDDVPAGSAREAMVRIVAREYLVEDLEGTLAFLDRTLHWEPDSFVERRDSRRAIMSFNAARSAKIELVQPASAGRVADAFDVLGPGAWTIRIAVVDLDAKASDLAARGTPFALENGVLRTDPVATLDVPFEFVTAHR